MNQVIAILLACVLVAAVQFVSAGTSISVENHYKKEVNVKIQGLGVGGCDILIQPGDSNPSDCWCLWGTLNYSFCAYTKMSAEELIQQKYAPATEPNSASNPAAVKSGRCPIITGESLLCSDLTSLGNCYSGGYACQIDVNGFCNCQVV
jgi:hypothetical protein